MCELFEMFDLMREYLCSCKSDDDLSKLKSELIDILSGYGFYEFVKYLASKFSRFDPTTNWYLVLERCLKLDIDGDCKRLTFSLLLIDGIALDVGVGCDNNELVLDVKFRRWEP